MKSNREELLKELTGLSLELCDFSLYGSTFYFFGYNDSKETIFGVAGNSFFSVLGDEFNNTRNLLSLKIQPFFGKKLSSIIVEEDEKFPKVTFKFSDSSGFILWENDPDMVKYGDMLMFTNIKTNGWFVVC